MSVSLLHLYYTDQRKVVKRANGIILRSTNQVILICYWPYPPKATNPFTFTNMIESKQGRYSIDIPLLLIPNPVVLLCGFRALKAKLVDLPEGPEVSRPPGRDLIICAVVVPSEGSEDGLALGVREAIGVEAD